MKMIKIALAAASALASVSASAGVIDTKPTGGKASTCYYEYSIITADAIYDVYTCYGNGDGTA